MMRDKQFRWQRESWVSFSRRLVHLLAVLVFVLSGPLRADPSSSTLEREVAPINQSADERKIGLRHGSVIVAPVPFSNPMIDAGLAVGASYLFQTDPGSDTSLVGVGYLESQNGTNAAALTFDLTLKDNRWGASGFYADADIKYDLISKKGTIPLSQTGTLARLQFDYGFTPDISIGIFTRYLETKIRSASPLFPGLPGNFSLTGGLEALSYGLAFDVDRRDDDLYPTKGWRLSFSAAYSESKSRLLSDYSKAYVLYDNYTPLGKDGVLASRLAWCAASGDAPFFDLCSVGGTDAFRGFNVTQFLDSSMISAQLEYRKRMTKRLGLVVFAGSGFVGGGLQDLSESGVAGGLGLRYRVSKKFPVDFAIDNTINDQGDSLLYISVGQRF